MARKIKLKRKSGKQKKRKQITGRPGVSLQSGILQQALAFHQAGRLPQAEALYRQILSAEPTHPEALNFLGLLAHQAGKSEIGVELIRKSISCRPDYVEAYSNLGIIFTDQGKLEKAVDSYRRALTLQPDYAEVHSNLGNVLKDQGRLDEAVASFHQALILKPDYAEVHYNLGNVLKAQGKVDAAIASYRQALTLTPDFTDAYSNLGVILNDQGKLDEAVESFQQALTLKPDYAEAHCNLGKALKDLGRLEEAVACYRRALALKPDLADAHSNLGNVLRIQGKLQEAVASYRQALILQPDYAEVHSNLGNALKDQGRFDEAVASFRQALNLNPDYVEAHSNLLFCLNYLPDITQKEIYEKSLQWDEQHAKVLPKEKFVYANSKKTERQLRIGYVSPDFKDHSVAYFIAPVLTSHKRENVAVYCYANVRTPDERTKRLQEASDHWRSIIGESDMEVVERIRQDRIDILVDLAGHTGEKRLLVFAYKPAPVQVSWLGYPNTTGMAAIDYRFTDATADPVGEADNLHSEELVRLEHGFLCYQPDASAPEVRPPPCLERGYLTFGSFNNLAKANPAVIKVWSEILRQEPRSQLVLKSKPLADSDTRKRYLQLFEENGISKDRLEFHGWLAGKHDHLELYHRIDIGLDPFPYNGTTTTCEALWMGVPVVTMLGDRHAARVGASIMQHAGLDELVADSGADYIALAVSLAQDRHRLESLRHSLRQKMQASQLMDKTLFTETLEKAYQQMWRKWCAEV